ncbi:MAG: nucleotide sugar dehydrogenase [Kiloniellales bacterium]|nr:nucleotide sugar dehydrogenase [Kiloniellales bacterium]
MSKVPREAERIAVIGLGYVGLPVAVAFARGFTVVGYDVDAARVAALGQGEDWTGEVAAADLGALTSLTLTDDPSALAGATAFIVAVPTPVDDDRRPDLGALLQACDDIGPVLSPGSLVVIESTVYPGVTEEICGPRLEAASGLRAGRDFTLGYSPERINPGDRERRLETVTKVVSGQDAATLDRVAALYGAVVEAGIHRAPSIKVAEAAKVIENTQRDLNIALMNELAIIFHRLGIPTRDVLAAARTKWNFLPFTPGLVGGHCIGVDPYYLTAKAEAVGYHPEVVLAGRRINDGMGRFIAQELLRRLAQRPGSLSDMRVAILGLTFKPDVPDLRNSKVPDIVAELASFGVAAAVQDPLAAAELARQIYSIDLRPWEALAGLDALVLAVPHRAYLERPPAELLAPLKPDGIVLDVKSALNPAEIPEGLSYWSL